MSEREYLERAMLRLIRFYEDEMVAVQAQLVASERHSEHLQARLDELLTDHCPMDSSVFEPEMPKSEPEHPLAGRVFHAREDENVNDAIDRRIKEGRI